MTLLRRCFFDEQTVTVGDDLDVFLCDIQITVGTTYRVTFNGVAYDCVAWESPDADADAYIGNGSVLSVDGGGEEPFLIGSWVSSGEGVWLDVTEPGDYTVSIKGMVETVHQIDEKYLPDADPLQEYDVIIKVGNYGDIAPRNLSYTKGSFKTFVEYFESGRPPKVLIDATFDDGGIFGSYFYPTDVRLSTPSCVNISIASGCVSYIIKAFRDGSWSICQYSYEDGNVHTQL